MFLARMQARPRIFATSLSGLIRWRPKSWRVISMKAVPPFGVADSQGCNSRLLSISNSELCSWGGTHGNRRPKRLARIRPVAQGKWRIRLDLGNWNASDGIGGPLFATSGQSDRIV